MELILPLLFAGLVSSVLLWSVLRRRRALSLAERYLSEVESHLMARRYREAEEILDKIPLPPAVWFAIRNRYLRVQEDIEDYKYRICRRY